MELIFDKDFTIETTYDFSPMRKNTFSETKVEELEGRELSDARRKKTRKLRESGEDLGFGREAQLTEEERIVERTRDYKTLFKKGQSIKTEKGINIIVGDNGCGKSSLIKELIKTHRETLRIAHLDLEKANPTINKPAPKKGVLHGYEIEEILNQFMWSIESHGETREGVLMGMLESDLDDLDVIILDEPEQGLSLKNQAKYYRKLEELKTEVLVITHSKVFIELAEKVFDVETMEWIDSKTYLKGIY